MDRIKITELYTYPLKSTRGQSLKSVEVLTTGHKNDRSVAVINSKNKIVTGRECPNLLAYTSYIEHDCLVLHSSKGEIYSLQLPNNNDSVDIKLIRNKIKGILFNDEANLKISSLLDGDYRLVYVGTHYRELSEARGGNEGEFTAFADSAPVHLINTKSLEVLNSKLKSKVSVTNFRPNIVVDGIDAFEEDNWTELKINNCLFRVQERTSRCIFTTIDPDTQTKDQTMQPLLTISKMRLLKGQLPTFGINLIPIQEGSISIGDNVIWS